METIIYHLFSDQRDMYIDDETEAYKLYHIWCEEYDNVRLVSMLDTGQDIIDIDCLESKGEFPL